MIKEHGLNDRVSGQLSFEKGTKTIGERVVSSPKGAGTLTMQIFVSKAMSLLFNMLSRLVIAFHPRSACLNFMATVRSD